MMKYLLFLISGLFLYSCKETEADRISRLVKEWNGKEIVFPGEMNFQTLGSDTNYLFRSDYSIITYVDSVGCMSCKLQLPRWSDFIAQLDSLNSGSVSVLFFLHPKNKKEMDDILKRAHFTHPVCFDEKDAFNKLNHFPEDMAFQTFLLDKENKVIAIGNPIHNPKVKELYLKMIMGDKAPKKKMNILTYATCSDTIIHMGTFDWHQEQKSTFTLTNSGNSPLVIIDVITSCGCTTVDYGKEPVRPGNSVELKVHYKADHPEHFDKTITVYCNTESSPLKLRIAGNAE